MKTEFQIQQTLDYIDEHLYEEISLDTLARQVCLSKYYYHRLFRQAVGEPVNRYVRRRRMTRAAKELAETNRPIIEIALNCQYASQEAFSRAFQRIYTLTPGKYRQLFESGRSNVIRMSAHVHWNCSLAA